MRLAWLSGDFLSEHSFISKQIFAMSGNGCQSDTEQYKIESLLVCVDEEIEGGKGLSPGM